MLLFIFKCVMEFQVSGLFISALLTIAVIVVSSWLVLGWGRRRKRLVTMMNKLPHSKGHILLGNLVEFRNVSREDLFTAKQRFMNQFRDETLHAFWVGWNDPRVELTKAESVGVLLRSTDNIEKSKFYTFLFPWLGRGLLTSGGSKWHSRRKILTPSFHYKILDEFLDVINEQAIVLANKLEHHASDNKSFDVLPFVSLCTLDIICETAMQKSVNAQSDNSSRYVNAVHSTARLLTRRIMKPLYHWDWLFALTPSARELKKHLQILHGFTDKVIAERRLEWETINNSVSMEERVAGEDDYVPKKRQAFLDTLLNCYENGEKLSDSSIREEVDTFMFEGHDTTSGGIIWALFLLGHHPSIQEGVRRELDIIFGTGAGNTKQSIVSSDLKEMKYLECVIKESLRLYPPVPLFARFIKDDFHIAGYDIPGGTTAQVDVFALHRDPRYFPDPETFNPDRFLPENSSTRPLYSYVPFSAGSRNCIGQKFALMEEKVVLAHLLRRFKVTSNEKREDVKLLAELILKPANGLWIKVEKRNYLS